MRDSDIQIAETRFNQRIEVAVRRSDQRASEEAQMDYLAAYTDFLASVPQDAADAAARLERVVGEACGQEGELRPIRETLTDALALLSSDQPAPALAAKLRWATEAAEVLAPDSDYTRIVAGILAGMTTLRAVE